MRACGRAQDRNLAWTNFDLSVECFKRAGVQACERAGVRACERAGVDKQTSSWRMCISYLINNCNTCKGLILYSKTIFV